MTDVYEKYGYDKDKMPFHGMIIGVEDEVAVNPYTEIEVTLNPVEIAVYDVLMGCYQLHLLAGNDGQMEQSRDMYNDYTRGKNWFIENNPSAYFDLID